MFVLSYIEHLGKGYFFLIWCKEKYLYLTNSTPVIAIEALNKTLFKTKAIILIKTKLHGKSVTKSKSIFFCFSFLGAILRIWTELTDVTRTEIKKKKSETTRCA